MFVRLLIQASASRCGALRLLASSSSSFDALANVKPIGVVQSCWQQKFGTPRQGCLAPDARATLRLELQDGLNAAHACEGLEEYSHVWLIWCFSLNGHEAGNSKVRVPRLRGGRAGLFATRTPFRPNPIGLSLARLERVDGPTLHLSGIDLVDGTPVIDVKPCVPAPTGAANTTALTVPTPLSGTCRGMTRRERRPERVRRSVKCALRHGSPARRPHHFA
jgi:tRNA (adenine37-N6)-methyltransferase